MKVEFIHRHNTDKLILIFAGWGSDTGSYRDVVMSGWDVAVVYGIDAVRPELSFLKEYSTVYLYAWSLGVWSADHLLGEYGYQPTRAYALNGTPLPCDDERGIPRQVFVGTAQGLSERNLEKFRIRMCGGRQLYEQNSYRFEQINNIKHLQEELLYVLSHTTKWHLK